MSNAASIAATQAAITRGTSASGAGTSWWSSQAVSMVASRNSSLATSARRNPALVVRPRIAVSSSARDQRPPGGLAVGAVRDHLAEHRVVRRADDLAALERVVDPHASVGHRTRLRRAGLRQEAAEGVLGVDPRLDRVPRRA